MNVIFVEPHFPRNQREFVRGLVQAGATVVAIGESAKEELDEQLRAWLFDYIQVSNVCDESQMVQAVFSRDIQLLQGVILFTVVLVVIASFLADLSYALINPKVRAE